MLASWLESFTVFILFSWLLAAIFKGGNLANGPKSQMKRPTQDSTL